MKVNKYIHTFHGNKKTENMDTAECINCLGFLNSNNCLLSWYNIFLRNLGRNASVFFTWGVIQVPKATTLSKLSKRLAFFCCPWWIFLWTSSRYDNASLNFLLLLSITGCMNGAPRSIKPFWKKVNLGCREQGTKWYHIHAFLST